MSDENWALEDDADEVREVLAALRGLAAKVETPVIRVCLEDAHDDIAHLTGNEPLPEAA